MAATSAGRTLRPDLQPHRGRGRGGPHRRRREAGGRGGRGEPGGHRGRPAEPGHPPGADRGLGAQRSARRAPATPGQAGRADRGHGRPEPATAISTSCSPAGLSLVSDNKTPTLTLAADPANGGHLAVGLRPVSSGVSTTVPPSSLGGAARRPARGPRWCPRQRRHAAWTSWPSISAGAVNTTHRAGFDLDGGTARDFFAPPATATGAAGRAEHGRRLAGRSPPPGRRGQRRRRRPGTPPNLHALIATERLALSDRRRRRSDPGPVDRRLRSAGRAGPRHLRAGRRHPEPPQRAARVGVRRLHRRGAGRT